MWKKVLLAVNKLDLVDYSEEVYNKIVSDYSDYAFGIDLTV